MAQLFRLNHKSGNLEPAKRTNFSLRQIVWINGYGQNLGYHDRLAIYDMYPGEDGTLTYKLVNIDKPGPIYTENGWSHIKPDSEIFGIGMYYTPGDFAEPEEIARGLANVSIFYKAEAEAEAKKKEEKKKEEEALLSKFANLRRTSKEEREYVTGAKNIRAELKAAFPKIKFSVRSEVFSGGDAIDVSWTDGPTTEEVNKIIGKYNDGHYNSQEEYYEYSERSFTKHFGGAKYVHANRKVTWERYIETAKKLGFEITIDEHFNFTGCEYHEKEEIQRATWEISFED